jgi:hypothetical protein
MSTHLILNRPFSFWLVVISLGYDEILIDVTTLFRNALSFDYLHAHDVLFVKVLCPPLWDPVLNFVFNHGFVGSFGECLRQWLFVQLVKLIVKLGYHLLNVGTLFLSIEPLNNSQFHVVLWEITLLNHWEKRLLSEDIFNFCIFVLSKELNIGLVHLSYIFVVNKHLRGLHPFYPNAAIIVLLYLLHHLLVNRCKAGILSQVLLLMHLLVLS